MRFTKNIISCVVGALLAASALGELTQVVRAPSPGNLLGSAEPATITRSTDLESGLRRRADACTQAIKQRRSAAHLEARRDGTIELDEWDQGKGQDTLTTNSLATCYGVAVTGSYEGGAGRGQYDRFLLHALEGEHDTPDEFFDAIRSARRNHGLGHIYALLVFPDPASFTDADDWTDEDRREIQEEHGRYVGWIRDAAGVAPEEKSHSYKEPWGIKINAFKGVQSGRFV